MNSRDFRRRPSRRNGTLQQRFNSCSPPKKWIPSNLRLATKRKREESLGKITIDFALVLELSKSRFAINGLSHRLKESLSWIRGTTLLT